MTRQAQIEDRARQIERQQQQIDALKALVCHAHPDADACNP
jgi:hypothetical protein